MDLETAANLLLRGDNQNYFKNIYKHYGKSNESPLKDYLEFIKSGMHEWFMLLPNYIAAKTTFSKPKTAIISVLKNVDVVKSLGKEYCEDFIASISNFYKTKGDEIFDLRKIQLQRGTKEGKEIEVSSDTEDAKQKYTSHELLQKKYDDLFIEYERLKNAFESFINLYDIIKGKSRITYY